MILSVPGSRAQEAPMSRAPKLSSSMPERISNAEAAEHDAWFRAEVHRALAEADDAQAEWASHEEIERDWVSQRAVLSKAQTARS
jgi:hypothetical protein